MSFFGGLAEGFASGYELGEKWRDSSRDYARRKGFEEIDALELQHTPATPDDPNSVDHWRYGDQVFKSEPPQFVLDNIRDRKRAAVEREYGDVDSARYIENQARVLYDDAMQKYNDQLGRRAQDLFFDDTGYLRDPTEVFSDPQMFRRFGSLVNEYGFEDLLNVNGRPVLFNGMVPGPDGTLTAALTHIDPETGERISTGPLTERRSSDPSDPPVFGTPSDAFRVVGDYLRSRSPAFAETWDTARSRGGLRDIYADLNPQPRLGQMQAAPPQRASPAPAPAAPAPQRPRSVAPASVPAPNPAPAVPRVTGTLRGLGAERAELQAALESDYPKAAVRHAGLGSVAEAQQRVAALDAAMQEKQTQLGSLPEDFAYKTPESNVYADADMAAARVQALEQLRATARDEVADKRSFYSQGGRPLAGGGPRSETLRATGFQNFDELDEEIQTAKQIQRGLRGATPVWEQLGGGSESRDQEKPTPPSSGPQVVEGARGRETFYDSPYEIPNNGGNWQLVQREPPTGDRYEAPNLQIEDRSDPDWEYSRSGTANAKPFKGIVFHHTGKNTDLDRILRYGHTVDKERGGSFGYHFLIDRDGSIVQAAPMSKRTNHAIPMEQRGEKWVRKQGLGNSNTLGVSLIAAEEGATPEQLEAARRLGNQLAADFRIPRGNIFGHGEVSQPGHRMASEGREIAQMLREAGVSPEEATSLADAATNPATPPRERQAAQQEVQRELSPRTAGLGSVSTPAVSPHSLPDRQEQRRREAILDYAGMGGNLEYADGVRRGLQTGEFAAPKVYGDAAGNSATYSSNTGELRGRTVAPAVPLSEAERQEAALKARKAQQDLTAKELANTEKLARLAYGSDAVKENPDLIGRMLMTMDQAALPPGSVSVPLLQQARRVTSWIEKNNKRDVWNLWSASGTTYETDTVGLAVAAAGHTANSDFAEVKNRFLTPIEALTEQGVIQNQGQARDAVSHLSVVYRSGLGLGPKDTYRTVAEAIAYGVTPKVLAYALNAKGSPKVARAVMEYAQQTGREITDERTFRALARELRDSQR